MADDPTPTTLRRQLGARLRKLRQERGETAQDVASALGVSLSKVSRMESGERAVNEQDLAALIDHYEVASSLADELKQTARGGKQRRRASVYVSAPETDSSKVVQSGFVELERDAEYVREFNSGLIPGLLQSRPYMEALMTSVAPEHTEALEGAIAQRLERQQRLIRPRRYSVIVDEAALARSVGDADVMAGQIALVLERVAMEAAEVRVIPFDAGYHPGLNSVFVTLFMGNVSHVPDVVFIEGLIGHQKFDKPEDVARFNRVWEELTARAASLDDSRSLLEQYRTAYEDAAS